MEKEFKSISEKYVDNLIDKKIKITIKFSDIKIFSFKKIINKIKDKINKI